MSTSQVIFDVLVKHTERDPAKLSREDLLTDLGISSLKFITMMLEIQRVSGRKVFDINTIGKLKTVGDLVTLAQVSP